MRKLASIQKVVDVRPIDGADKIECVQIEGWEVVAKKGEFKKDGLAIYFEIDCALPTSDKRYSFLAERKIKMPDGTEKIEKKVKIVNGIESVILKTVKLRKQISQGLVLPLSEFPEIKNPEVGQDVSELLKVQKYEALDAEDVEVVSKDNTLPVMILNALDYIPQPLFIRKRLNIIRSNMKKKKRGPSQVFPSFIPTTDEERIQNCWMKLSSMPNAKELVFEATNKIDGSSGTFFINKGDYGVCSRNIRKNMKDQTIRIKKIAWLPTWLQSCEVKILPAVMDNFCKISIQYEIQRKLIKVGKNIAIQGEVYGEGIQGNSEGIVGHKFYVFNIYDIDAHRYLSPIERYTMLDLLNANDEVKLEHVPIIDKGIKVFEKFDSLEKLLAFSEGKCFNNPKREREGIVYKLVSDDGRDLSFKAISNKYLLGKTKSEE